MVGEPCRQQCGDLAWPDTGRQPLGDGWRQADGLPLGQDQAGVHVAERGQDGHRPGIRVGE